MIDLKYNTKYSQNHFAMRHLVLRGLFLWKGPTKGKHFHTQCTPLKSENKLRRQSEPSVPVSVSSCTALWHFLFLSFQNNCVLQQNHQRRWHCPKNFACPHVCAALSAMGVVSTDFKMFKLSLLKCWFKSGIINYAYSVGVCRPISIWFCGVCVIVCAKTA